MSDVLYPLPLVGARLPQISHEFESTSPGVGVHLGVDLMYKYVEGDPTDSESKSGAWVMLPNTHWLACCDGEALYSELRKRGWALRLRTSHGFDALYMHGLPGSSTVTPGQRVLQGFKMGVVNFDPMDAAHLKHLHFEVRVPSTLKSVRDGYGCIPIDPAKILSTAGYGI